MHELVNLMRVSNLRLDLLSSVSSFHYRRQINVSVVGFLNNRKIAKREEHLFQLVSQMRDFIFDQQLALEEKRLINDEGEFRLLSNTQ